MYLSRHYSRRNLKSYNRDEYPTTVSRGESYKVRYEYFLRMTRMIQIESVTLPQNSGGLQTRSIRFPNLSLVMRIVSVS